MNLEIAFELTETDLDYFREKFRDAGRRTAARSPEELAEAARILVRKSADRPAPEFVRSRFQQLEALAEMAIDDAWQLPDEDRDRVLELLAYCVEPMDVVADEVPAFGLIDDAIAVELVLRAARHELEAYKEFSEYRHEQAQRRANEGRPTDITKEDWLADRRAALHSRYRQRRGNDISGWQNSLFSWGMGD